MSVKKYKIVRRGQKYCVRVKGVLNTTETFGYCRDRNMSYHIKKRYPAPCTWKNWTIYDQCWDYDFIFDKESEATMFIMGCLI